MICPLYKAALISNMGKNYDTVLFLDNVWIETDTIIGCDQHECGMWNSDVLQCGMSSMQYKMGG